MRAERYSAHGGGDDYKESHEDDPNDPPPRPVPRHPFVDVLMLVHRFFFIIVAQGTIVKGGYALIRKLRFTGSKEGGWGVDTHLFPCSCGTIRRGQKAVFMARKNLKRSLILKVMMKVPSVFGRSGRSWYRV